MAVETATFISSLNPAYPAGTDGLVEGDNHIRLTKGVIKNSFPNISGAVTSTHINLSNPILQSSGATDTIPYFTSGTTAGTTPFTAFGRSLVGCANGPAAASLLGLTGSLVPTTGGVFTGSVAFDAATTFNAGLNATGITITGSYPALTLADTDNSTRTVLNDGGSIGFTNASNTWAMRVDDSGTVYAGDFAITSDARVKSNVETISDALAITDQLRGVTFYNNRTQKFSMGVIAQEVERVLPYLVHRDADGFCSVSYANMAGLFIEAIKDLTDEVRDLKARLELAGN